MYPYQLRRFPPLREGNRARAKVAPLRKGNRAQAKVAPLREGNQALSVPPARRGNLQEGVVNCRFFCELWFGD